MALLKPLCDGFRSYVWPSQVDMGSCINCNPQEGNQRVRTIRPRWDPSQLQPLVVRQHCYCRCCCYLYSSLEGGKRIEARGWRPPYDFPTAPTAALLRPHYGRKVTCLNRTRGHEQNGVDHSFSGQFGSLASPASSLCTGVRGKRQPVSEGSSSQASLDCQVTQRTSWSCRRCASG